jgi:sulfur-oxidizing protein SoxY
MDMDRREVIVLGLGGVAALVLPLPVLAAADDAIAAYTGGAEVAEGGVTLTAPEIAENGNTVPISVSAAGAAEIVVFANGNPNPEVAVFRFGPLAGSNEASTRIRLAQTQDLIAIAKMPDGTLHRTSKEVKVTIGGCGG